MEIKKSRIALGALGLSLLMGTGLIAMEVERDASEWLTHSPAPVNTMASLDNEFENEIFPIIDGGIYDEFLESRNRGIRPYKEFSLIKAAQYYSPSARSYRAVESKLPEAGEREFKNNYMDEKYQQMGKYCDFIVPFSSMKNPKEQFEGYYGRAMDAVVGIPTLGNELNAEYQSSIDRSLNSQYGLPASFSFIDSYPFLQDTMESATGDTKKANVLNSYCGVSSENLVDTEKFIEHFLSKTSVEENDNTEEDSS